MRYNVSEFHKVEISASNCTITIEEGCFDKHNREATRITITPNKYPDSNKIIRVGGCANIRCITLKSKPKRRK